MLVAPTQCHTITTYDKWMTRLKCSAELMLVKFQEICFTQCHSVWQQPSLQKFLQVQELNADWLLDTPYRWLQIRLVLVLVEQAEHKSLTPPTGSCSGKKRKLWQESNPVSSEISDFTPCTHAQSNILRTKYADKTDFLCWGIRV